MINNVAALLTRARELLLQEGNWAKGTFAIDQDRKPITWSNESACGFCAMGAMYRAGRELKAPVYVADAAFVLLYNALPDRFVSLPEFNDHERTTHEDVIRVFDAAIGAMNDAQPL